MQQQEIFVMQGAVGVPLSVLVEAPQRASLRNFGQTLPGALVRPEQGRVVRGSAKLDTAWPIAEIMDEPNIALAATWWVRRKSLPDRPTANMPYETWAARIVEGRRNNALEWVAHEFTDVGAAVALTNALTLIEDRSLWKYAQSAFIRGDLLSGDLTLMCQFARGRRDRFLCDLHGMPVTAQFKRFIDRNVAPTTTSRGQPKAQASQKFDVFRRRENGTRFICAKGDRHKTPLVEFDAQVPIDKVFLHVRENHAALIQAYEEHKAARKITMDDVRAAENRFRQGPVVRDGDIKPEAFSDALRMRGVEYGLWVGQGDGLKERQGMLNAAYDGFKDLSRVLGIQMHALALGGKLGLALGSRGSGRASAHYEPANLVINMTKTRGAGCLAHEWFHALDHAMAGHTGFASDLHVSRRLGHMTALMRAIKASKLPERCAYLSSYWSEPLEMAARSFECYVLKKLEAEGGHSDYLVNVRGPEEFAACGKNVAFYPYLLEEEKTPDSPIMKAFDGLFAELRNGLLQAA